MRSLDLAPDPALLESMRSIGYTVEAAVADVVDNSIAAEATCVEILVSDDGPFEVAILDDGTGMTQGEAVEAMRLAATSPSQERRPGDLGRFGLGLKTASLSQCRMLTLVTKRDGVTTALRWSLDHVRRRGSWALLELDRSDVEAILGWSQLEARAQGTLVHWGDLDQVEMTEGGEQEDLDRVAVRVRDHLALVFHQFIAGDQRTIRFLVNGGEIAPIDPFMSGSRLTAHTPWEPITVEGQTIRLMAYTLPYLSRLSGADRARALRLGGLRETQGFYVYRGGRLVIWGTWFRVMSRSEMAKLTRVRVDIPNSLDHLWALDVKKSTADPPPQVRRRLSELARTMMMPSQRVQEFRGLKLTPPPNIDHMWDLRVNGDEFAYEVNSQHPVVNAFARALPEGLQQRFRLVLADLASTFPVIDAHNRMSGDAVPGLIPEDDALVRRALEGWELLRGQGPQVDDFITAISASEPYCLVLDIEKKLRSALT